MDMSEPASVVLAPGTAAVLRALAGTERSFTMRRLAWVAGVSTNRARQVVLRLAEHGLVLLEEQGPSTLCKLNRDHLACTAVIQLTQLRATLLQLLHSEIAGWAVLPEHASLYGSAARGDGDTTSDLDILVIRPGRLDDDDESWRDQLFGAEERIHAATGNHVSWLDISLTDLRRAIHAGEEILNEWEQDSLRLSGTDLRALLREVA